MKKHKLKAFCKVNLSLRVIKKLKNNYHAIQSFVTFVGLHDVIYIAESKEPTDKVTFAGEFKNAINTRSNTITKVLNLLRRKGYLGRKAFKIRVTKNIPHGSGLGGGSSNAASLINFFNIKMKLKLSKKKIYQLASSVGSDVVVNLQQQNSYITSRKLEILRLKKKIKFNILIVFSHTRCSTKKIYNKNKKFSSTKLVSCKVLSRKKTLINFLQNEQNDLEKTVIKIYPKIGKIIQVISVQKGCYLSRITGSGSACIGLFSSLKTATLAKKIIKKCFPRYWCVVSKTI